MGTNGGPARMHPVSSWGRLSRADHHLLRLHDRAAPLPQLPAGATGLPFGNGRSYGDVCLNAGGGLWLARGLDRFIAFDRDTGVLECESGVLLDEIIAVALPHGWFLPVTPGTRYATLGGAIANDVHGKNHHRAGTLGEHVLALTLQRSDGSRMECSPEQNPDWMAATIGGMGLTGVISSVTLRLLRVPGPWMDVEALPFGTLAEFFAHSQSSEAGWDYIVAWIDCVHGTADAVRGILFRANHAAADGLIKPVSSHRVPLTPPLSLVNRLTLRAFNAAYFQRQRLRQGRRLQHLLAFFYPLDGLLEWNRIYGPRGFYQYQCVVPEAVQEAAIAALLDAVRRSGSGSFLAVLKTFGKRDAPGVLSFPMAGTTLALDFPNRGDSTTQLFSRLDAVVRDAGGRIYPAKDSRMGRDLFRTGYPRWAELKPYRDPAISSDMSRRLFDD